MIKIFGIFLLGLLALGFLPACAMAPMEQAPPPGMTQSEATAAQVKLNRAINDLAGELTAGARRRKLSRVAVLDPAGPGKDLTELSSYLSDKLIKRFVAMGAFGRVLERRRLHDVMVQQQLELSSHFDPKTVAPLGRKLGVDGLVLGQVRRMGSRLLEVSLKLVKVETGEVLAAADTTIALDGLTADLLRRPLSADVRVVVEPAGVKGSASLDGDSRTLSSEGAVFAGVRQGARVISVSAPGYRSESRTVYITGDRTYGFRLKALTGRLELRVSPADASVEVDGRAVDLDSDGGAVLTVGQGLHQVTASAEGYEPAARQVRVERAGAVLALDLSKEPDGHWLWLSVSPPQAQVSIDGQPASLDGEGKLSRRMPPGEHHLLVTAAGYGALRRTVKMEADHELGLTLKPRQVVVASAPAPSPPMVVRSVRPATSLLRLDFSAVYRTPGGGLRDLVPGSVLTSGTGYALSFQPSRHCWVYVFQVDGTGRFFRLFPKPAGGLSNPVAGGRRYWIPGRRGWLHLDQVPGREVIFVVASQSRNLELERLYGRLTGIDDPLMRGRIQRQLMRQIHYGPAAGVQPGPARRLAYGGGVLEVTEQVLLASGADMVYSIEFLHR